MVEANRGRTVERIREQNLNFHQLRRVQIQGKADFGIPRRGRVDSVKDSAHCDSQFENSFKLNARYFLTDKHFADLVVVDADVQAVHDFQRRFVNFRDNGVIRVGRRMDNPQSIVIRIEINDVVLCRVEVLSYVDVLEDFGGC